MTADPPTPGRQELVAAMADALTKVTGNTFAGGTLSESSRLRDDLGLDSFAGLELMFEIEDRTNVRIPQDVATSFQTVGDVVAYVEQALTTSPAAAEASP